MSAYRSFSSASTREQATAEHCLYAFSVLEAHLLGNPLPEPLFDDACTALFVTWNVRSGSSADNIRLRGCIGTLEPRQLHTALKDYALTAALRDSRFPPIEVRELPRLSCKVSLLSCFETAASWQDWEVGQHGIVIEFTDPQLRCRRSATFLPEVAYEQGWTIPETLDHLVRKSGYTGRVDAALLSSIHLTRYQSSVTGMSWAQYQEAVRKAGDVSNDVGVAAIEEVLESQLVSVAANGRSN